MIQIPENKKKTDQMQYTKNVRKQLDEAENSVREAIDLKLFNAGPLKQREKAIQGALLKAGIWEEYEERRDKILGVNEKWKAEGELSEVSFDRLYKLQEEYYNKVGTGWRQKAKKKDLKKPLRRTKMVNRNVAELWEIYDLASDVFNTEEVEEIKEELREIDED